LPELFTRVTGHRAAWRDLTGRGILRVTGKDRVRFLNGMLTNDVATLGVGDLCYAALLDRKGRVQADLWVLALEGSFLLDTAPGTGAEVAGILAKHVIADDVEIEDRSEGWSAISIEGPGARDVLVALEATVPDEERLVVSPWHGRELVWVGRGSLGPEGIGVLGRSGDVSALVSSLEIPALSDEQAEILRVEAFLPRLGVDVSDRNLPQEARLDHAISWTKGCYIGQEIVARIQSRGRVNRLLVKIGTERGVEPGAPITAEGKSVGEVTSAVLSPVGGPVALGYVRSELARPGTEVEVAGCRGVVLGPPLDEGEAGASTRR
jgi:folate-binding protein YgfZ